ncbi:hypothetical protein MRB53_039700 [Persea americana]|nr:hypothetical protein MRB53_039700 [Persea americana]
MNRGDPRETAHHAKTLCHTSRASRQQCCSCCLLCATKSPLASSAVADLVKQQEQLGSAEVPVTSLFDFCFAENGADGLPHGQPLASHSFIKWIGEDNYKRLVKFILHYIADLDVPVKRGTFIEFRNGMINVSPIGRNASVAERTSTSNSTSRTRSARTFIAAIKKEFTDLSLTYSIGGQISFDIFPTGWDKTYCLQHVANEKNLPGGVDYTTIHFFGDKTYKGGNDFEIFEDSRTIGHTVTKPEDTAEELKKLFNL